jgi:two-component system, cell cycle response regulator DivK
MLATKKILVAEDSSIIINLVRKVLQFEDYEIHEARNGKEVLEMIQNEPYDLILMDIIMPVMDGMTCIKKIRANDNPKIANLPIVVITGNYKNYQQEDFEAVGVHTFLQKPFNFDRLLEIVRNYMEAA